MLRLPLAARAVAAGSVLVVSTMACLLGGIGTRLVINRVLDVQLGADVTTRRSVSRVR